MTALELPLLQPLPRQVKPFPGETTTSYLRRLALANRLEAVALRSHITGGQRQSAPVPVARLAIVTSLPEHTLRCALPDLSLARGRQARDVPVSPIWRNCPRSTVARRCAAGGSCVRAWRTAYGWSMPLHAVVGVPVRMAAAGGRVPRVRLDRGMDYIFDTHIVPSPRNTLHIWPGRSVHIWPGQRGWLRSEPGAATRAGQQP
jgi:hypothetical protein